MATPEGLVRKVGRPRMPEHIKRTETIAFRVTKNEADTLYSRAKVRGQTIGEYLRDTAIRVGEF